MIRPVCYMLQEPRFELIHYDVMVIHQGKKAEEPCVIIINIFQCQDFSKRQDHHQTVLNLSMSASYSFDASSKDSLTHSHAMSSGKVVKRISVSVRKK